MPTIRSQSSRVSRRKPGAFGAEHPRDRTARRRRRTGSRRRRRRRGSRRPCAFRSRSVRARLVTVMTGTVSAAPLAAFADRGVEADGAVLRHDHRVRAERIGVAQAGAEVVRIGDAVEHQQQRRLRERIEHVVERDVRHRRVDDRHDALVPRRCRRAASAARRRSRGSGSRAASARATRSRMRASRRAAARWIARTDSGRCRRRAFTAWNPNRERVADTESNGARTRVARAATGVLV